MEICGKEKISVQCVYNTKESAIADDTMMTPSPTAADRERYLTYFVSPPTGLS